MASQTQAKKLKTGHHNALLSDVTVKFSGQEVFAHKSTLSTHCEYFFTAFTGLFAVAQSGEINLGDDDDPAAVHAMLRHLYQLPYDKPDNTVSNQGTKMSPLFHIAVFTVADKYDVPTLRTHIVDKFNAVMKASWKGLEFATAIKELCSPESEKMADQSLRDAAVKFCSEHIEDLGLNQAFKNIFKEDKPFGGRLLVQILEKSPPKPKPAALFKCHGCGNFGLSADFDHSCSPSLGFGRRSSGNITMFGTYERMSF